MSMTPANIEFNNGFHLTPTKLQFYYGILLCLLIAYNSTGLSNGVYSTSYEEGRQGTCDKWAHLPSGLKREILKIILLIIKINYM